MIPRLQLRFGLMLVCAGCLSAVAQTTYLGEDKPAGRTGRDVEPPADENGTLGLPYREILRSERVPNKNAFRPMNVGARLQPKIGDARAEFRPNIVNARLTYDLPFAAAGAPTDAEIRVGRFYLDVLALSGSVLYSDNANQSEHNRKAGAIGMVTLTTVAIFQFTDNLRLAFRAGLAWFPFENKFGIGGFFRDPISGRFFAGDDYFSAQFTYDLRLSKWNIHFFDYFRASAPLVEDDNFLILNSGGGFQDEEDRIGRYAFSSRRVTGGAGAAAAGNRVNESDRHLYNTFLRLANTVGVSADRLLPTDTRMELGFYHSDYWYLANDDSLSLPRTRDVAHASLNSERETLRFKPFLAYRTFRYNEGPWNQEIRMGVRGPITENMNLLASAGYYISGATGAERWLTQVRLQHTIGPQTYQQLEYRRDISFPEEDLEQTYAYNLRQILGPYLLADAFFAYSTFEDLNRNGTGTREWRTGIQFISELSSKTSIRLRGVYTKIEYDNRNLGEWERWTALGQIRHRFGDSIVARLTYQYQQRDSTVANDSYYENVAVLTLTKYFNRKPRRDKETSSPSASSASESEASGLE